MSKIRTVVFDLDGTLIDSSRDITAAVNATRKFFGLEPLTVHEVIGCIGSGVTTLIEKSIFSGGVTDMAKAREVLIKHYTEHLLEETVVYPGIAALIEELRGKYNLAIATNKPLNLTIETIKGIGLKEAFGAIGAPETTGQPKPETGMLEHISSEFATNPEETMMVGDSPVDIEVAKNFGCKACAVTWGYNVPEVLHGLKPDHVIHEPLDLLSYLSDKTI
jgi:2-phosphoglycolate phosphatase